MLREFAYNHAAGMLYFDGVTAAPKGSYVSLRQDALRAQRGGIFDLEQRRRARDAARALGARGRAHPRRKAPRGAAREVPAL